MKWNIQYRIKGTSEIKTEIVDVHFNKKNEVKDWWLSKTSIFVDCIGSKIVGGYRQDKEWINCKKI